MGKIIICGVFQSKTQTINEKQGERKDKTRTSNIDNFGSCSVHHAILISVSNFP